MNSVISNNQSEKYKRFASSGCRDIGIRKFGFLAKTQFLYNLLSVNNPICFIVSLWPTLTLTIIDSFRVFKLYESYFVQNNKFIKKNLERIKFFVVHDFKTFTKLYFFIRFSN